MRIIAGLYKNQQLKVPKGLATRPTSSQLREAVFNILQHQIEGTRFLDLFAGTGAMGLEALSRGASYAAFVEDNRECARIIQENIAKLKVQKQTTLLFGDCLAQLPRLVQLEKPFNIIYADPPYATKTFSYGKLVLEAIDASTILSPQGILFIEESPHFEKQLPTLKNLTLSDSRKSGRSMLFKFLHL